jgi:hypothetical protein
MEVLSDSQQFYQILGSNKPTYNPFSLLEVSAHQISEVSAHPTKNASYRILNGPQKQQQQGQVSESPTSCSQASPEKTKQF